MADKARKSAVIYADKYCSLYIRARDGRCIQCSTTQRLTNGHIWSRIAYSTRWYEPNLYTQCWGHNVRHEYDAYPFFEVVRKLIGQEEMDAIHLKHVTPQKFTTAEIREIGDIYKHKWKELTSE